MWPTRRGYGLDMVAIREGPVRWKMDATCLVWQGYSQERPGIPNSHHHTYLSLATLLKFTWNTQVIVSIVCIYVCVYRQMVVIGGHFTSPRHSECKLAASEVNVSLTFAENLHNWGFWVLGWLIIGISLQSLLALPLADEHFLWLVVAAKISSSRTCLENLLLEDSLIPEWGLSP